MILPLIGIVRLNVVQRLRVGIVHHAALFTVINAVKDLERKHE